MAPSSPAFVSSPSEADRCLRLFLSVDISGSTEYKNKHSDFKSFDKHWPRFYESFFEDFPTLFTKNVFAEFGDARKCPEVWKCLGDEIIYEDKVSGEKDCHKLIRAFYTSISKYDSDVRNGKFGGSSLRVKGACWTAGFPLRNTVLMVPGRNGDVELDYIGPDLDIGFRLSKASRPGRVVLSMDLADVLTRDNTFPNPLELHHVGWEILKGVFGDKPYPIIWAKKNGEEPHILPWEDHLCPLTESFLKEENKKDVRALRVLITSVRTELPQLELFPPYFTSEEMPQSHQEYWKGWKDSFVRDRNQDAMNQGEDLA